MYELLKISVVNNNNPPNELVNSTIDLSLKNNALISIRRLNLDPTGQIFELIKDYIGILHKLKYLIMVLVKS
jgi:hypothetical protein